MKELLNCKCGGSAADGHLLVTTCVVTCKCGRQGPWADSKAEAVAAWNADRLAEEKAREDIAAILRREYGDVRREALEEALQAMQQVLAEHSLSLDYSEDGRYTWPERWVALEKKIRHAEETR